MKTMRLFPLELRRLLQSRLTWLMMALTVLSPVLGLGALQARHLHHHALHVSGKPRDCRRHSRRHPLWSVDHL